MRQREILLPRRLLQWAGPWIQRRLEPRLSNASKTSSPLWRQSQQGRPRRDPPASEGSAGELGSDRCLSRVQPAREGLEKQSTRDACRHDVLGARQSRPVETVRSWGLRGQGLLARPESARQSAYGRRAEVVVHRNRLMLKPITLLPGDTQRHAPVPRPSGQSVRLEVGMGTLPVVFTAPKTRQAAHGGLMDLVRQAPGHPTPRRWPRKCSLAQRDSSLRAPAAHAWSATQQELDLSGPVGTFASSVAAVRAAFC